MSKKVVTISLFGATAVGKSTINKILSSKISNATRLPLDYCLKSKKPDESFEEYFLRDNVDWDYVENVLTESIGTPISLSKFDYDQFVRTSQTGGKAFVMDKIVLLDGVYPYRKADYVIGLTVDEDIRKGRLLKRHLNERKQKDSTWVNFCLKNWDRLEEPVEKYRDICNLVIDTKQNIDKSILQIENLIRDTIRIAE